MGREIDRDAFTREEFAEFQRRLRDETELLRTWVRDGRLAGSQPRLGLELEACIVDDSGRPAPRNQEVIDAAGDGRVENELARYNLELNTDVHPLRARPFSTLEAELDQRWGGAREAAHQLGLELGLFGILPSLRESDFTLAQMTPSPRYTALNNQVLALRNRQPLTLDIAGAEPLHLEHPDVMLEAATTSLQLHLQVAPERSADAFNAAVAVSAATVGVAANAPFLFGHRLWEETRVPLFEQAVAVTPLEPDRAGPLARVGFGSGYARDELYGFFVENRQHHPVLLPVLLDEPEEALAHLRLHNGTIWRWNRPLVEVTGEGCHLRIEHRVMSAGPTLRDVLGNAAFFYGLVMDLMDRQPNVVESLPFETAEANFYAAARHGLDAEVEWFGGWRGPLAVLIQEQLLEVAERGLARAGVAEGDAATFLRVIERRAATAQNGAAWQRGWRQRHGTDMDALTRAYLERAAQGMPVHEWPL